jgi:hypothetical protein
MNAATPIGRKRRIPLTSPTGTALLPKTGLTGLRRSPANDESSMRGESMVRQLNVGDLFPDYQVSTTDGRSLRLPQDLAGEYSALIFYRGSW